MNKKRKKEGKKYVNLTCVAAMMSLPSVLKDRAEMPFTAPQFNLLKIELSDGRHTHTFILPGEKMQIQYLSCHSNLENLYLAVNCVLLTVLFF